MSGSFVVFDSLIGQLIEWIQPHSALDMGAGTGKYGALLKARAPHCRRVAVEPQVEFSERFSLPTAYDELHTRTGAEWQAQASGERFDVAILGDCLSHMPKSQGQDLLNFLVYRCAYLLVVAPEFMPDAQGASEHEVRRSVWSERDLRWHDLWAWDNCRATGLFLLRGYLPLASAGVPTLAGLVERVNAAHLPIHDFHDAASLVRPARLRLVEQPREVSYRPA